jgi:hypothetical protein
MEITEQTSGETIQNLEMAVADLEYRLSQIKAVLNQQDLPAEERIRMALGADP